MNSVKEKQKQISIPSTEALEKELNRVKYKETYNKTFKTTIFYLISVAAVAVLIATLVLPIFRIYGTSMTPTLNDGDLIVAVKGSEFERSDIIAFYYNNKILVKRVIATSGQWVEIDEEGNVKIDGVELDEPYIDEKALGECDIEFPYQVPEGKVFVMGDHRNVSVDSRSTSVGCVSEEQIVGKLVIRFWPFESIDLIS